MQQLRRKPLSGRRSLGLIKEHFRGELPSNEDRTDHCNVPQKEQTRIQFVIATLPDPLRTHMALGFDREIEMIESSAQASGFLFARAWMPWDISTHPESRDFTVRRAQDQFNDAVESLPGLMIFQRSANGDPQRKPILFVFVVGETPTGGLRIAQFENALAIRDSMLANADPQKMDTTLRILGPTFSGSLLSLAAILKAHHQHDQDQFSTTLIRSGTLSSCHAIRSFEQSVSQEWPVKGDEGAGRAPADRPQFLNFQFSNEAQEYYLSVFLRSRTHNHSRIAILSEDETAFGNQDPLAGDDACDSSFPPPDSPFVKLYFPRGIAQLRDAYQRDVKSQTQSDAGRIPPQAGLALSLNLTGNDGDSVASYSPAQTPPSEESVLQGIVGTLRQNHARVVVIRGGDTLDVVFLSRYLRQNYPQARLVTISADLLMIHEFYEPQFHGILAVTPYPLLYGAQFPDFEDRPSGAMGTQRQERAKRVFSDSYSVGEFNAFESLLAGQADLETGELPPASYAEFGLPSFLGAGLANQTRDQIAIQTANQSPVQTESDSRRARLWLTTIGRDAYWPVAVLDASDKNLSAQAKGIPAVMKSKQASGEREPTQYVVCLPVGWKVLWALAMTLTILLSSLLAFVPTFSRSETLGRFGGDPDRRRNWLLFVASMLLLTIQVLFAFPVAVWAGRFAELHPIRSDGWREVPNLDDVIWEVTGLVFSGLLLGIACYQRFRKPPARAAAVRFTRA